MRLLDLTVLLIYLLGTLGFGLWIGRRSKNPIDFTTGGGRLPSWALGLSIFGTYVSAFSFLALPGKSFDSNWNFFAFSLTIPLLAWVADRKSTRLNSSHALISYAVFCLKKKKNK